jgi:hypothetical protein
MSMITPDQRRAAKAHLLVDLQEGSSVPEAHMRTTIPLLDKTSTILTPESCVHQTNRSGPQRRCDSPTRRLL